jgi:hypothetical protein
MSPGLLELKQQHDEIPDAAADRAMFSCGSRQIFNHQQGRERTCIIASVMALVEEDRGWISWTSWISESLAKRQRELKLMCCHCSGNNLWSGFESALNMDSSVLGCIGAGDELRPCYMSLEISKGGEFARGIYRNLKETIAKYFRLHAEEVTTTL